MILSNPQLATLQRVLAACNHALPRIEMLEQVGTINPQMRQRAEELRAQREYQVQLATMLLEINRQAKD